MDNKANFKVTNEIQGSTFAAWEIPGGYKGELRAWNVNMWFLDSQLDSCISWELFKSRKKRVGHVAKKLYGFKR